MEAQKNPYTDYEGKPEFLLPEGFQIRDRDDGIELADRNGKFFRMVERKNFFDQLIPTMRGLLADLTQGSPLAESFQEEWEAYEEGESDMSGYGTLVYYPRRGHVVRFAPPFWHRLSLVVRNGTLFLDPEMKLDWQKVRNRFEQSVPAVAGCSLGNHVVHAVVFNVRPLHVKIADQDIFDLTNANRMRISYDELGRNKAIVTAEQLHAIDPFLKISVFNEGIHAGNIDDFIGGNPSIGEPPATVVIDEVDNPDIKMLIRRKARELRKPVVMSSDVGSGAERDVQRYDLDPGSPLVIGGMSDEEISAVEEQYRKNPSLGNFFQFAFGLIGHTYRQMPEFKIIVESLMHDGVPPEFGGAPQLGSTAMVAAGLAGEAVPRIILGHELKERTFINITNAERRVSR